MHAPGSDADPLARCVGDVDAFATEHWGRRPMLRRGAGPFDDLLDLGAVDQLLTTAARRPTFRLVRDGSPLPVADYTTTVRMGGAAVDGVADLGRIGEHVAAGATLVLQGLHRTWPPLIRFCRALERATRQPAQANAYLTPPGAAGLGRHRDGHDVLVLQVSGTKGWDVDGLGTFELAPGDVVYLPIGTAHAATAQVEPSLHLTIGLLRETYRDVLVRVLDGLDPGLGLGLRDPLPLGHVGLDRELARVLRDVAAALGDVDVGEVAAAEGRRAERRRKPLLDGHVRSVLAVASLDDATVVRCRPDNPAVLGPAAVDGGGADRIAVELVDRTVELPAYARPAVEALLAAGWDGDGVRVGDLPDLTPDGRAVLVRRFVREGLLEVVDLPDRADRR